MLVLSLTSCLALDLADALARQAEAFADFFGVFGSCSSRPSRMQHGGLAFIHLVEQIEDVVRSSASTISLSGDLEFESSHFVERPSTLNLFAEEPSCRCGLPF